MTFRELRAKSGMTQKAFAEYFGMSQRAVESWDGGQRQCPEYLLNLMLYKLEKEGIICEKVYVKIPQDFEGDLINEIDKQLAKAHKEAALLEMKQKLKDHEEWKKKHPRPKRKEEN